MASILAYWQYTSKRDRKGYRDKYEKDPKEYYKECKTNREAPYGDNCYEVAKELWDQLREGKDRIYQITQKEGKLCLICTFIVAEKRDDDKNLYGPYEAKGKENDPASQFFYPPKEIDITDLLKRLKVITGKPKTRAGWAENFQGRWNRFRKFDLGMEMAIEDHMWPHRKAEYKEQNKRKPISKPEDENVDRFLAKLGITHEQITLGRQGEEWFISRMDEGKLMVEMNGKQSILIKPKNGKLDRRNDSCGYDFDCIKDGQPIFLEVKAFAAFGGNVFLTRNEWNKASNNRNQYWILGLSRDKVSGDFKPMLLSGEYIRAADWEPLTRVCKAQDLFSK